MVVVETDVDVEIRSDPSTDSYQRKTQNDCISSFILVANVGLATHHVAAVTITVTDIDF